MPNSKTPEKFPQIYRSKPSVLQINTGKRCNQTCEHCHVSAGPDRTEDMSAEVADHILDFARKQFFYTADITGGAPEINAQFPKLLEGLTKSCRRVIVRCNLTAALSRKKSSEELFTKFRPEIVASLPCYTEETVDAQRGDGTFEKSIKALQWLNELGYGTDYKLTLVYNPLKPMLPPDGKELEKLYHKEMKERYGIVFTDLIAIANVPVGRYKEHLQESNLYDNYLDLLKKNFNADTVEGLMCRTHINVDWQGNVFDCDFNGQVEMHPFTKPKKIWNLKVRDWVQKEIRVDDHCFTCTAGCGSSCGGSIS